MHTICRTPLFQRRADENGLSEDEIEEIETFLAENPLAGDEIVGTGGCRKVRFAGRGKGKSGGYRVVTFFSGDRMPVFLVTMLSKGQKANFSQAQRNEMAKVTKAIAATYGKRVVRAGVKR